MVHFSIKKITLVLIAIKGTMVASAAHKMEKSVHTVKMNTTYHIQAAMGDV